MGVPYAEIIGDPVAHSKSPAIHGFWLEAMGLDGDYRRTRVRANQLGDYFQSRRDDPDWRGCNVTMPLKQAVLAHVDRLVPTARRIEAVNTIVRTDGELVGHNTDWQGVNLALGDWRAEGKDVVLIGAGGAARAALEELRQAHPRRLVIMNRTPGKAAALLDHFGLQGEVAPIGDPPAADLLINASALGMEGRPPLAPDLSALPAHAIVFDMVYLPLETALLKAARALGLRSIDGLDMLICQASMAFALFFGRAPGPSELPALRERLVL
jgi:shikimate dehydrogenase